MSDVPSNDATSIWDQRYEEGGLACTEKQVVGDPIDYTQHPFLYRHSIAKPLTGSLNGNPLEIIASRFLDPPPDNVLAIGSGLAFEEEWLIRTGHARHIIAYENSSVAVESARERFGKAGLGEQIEMRCGDVMLDDLQPGSFDMVFVQAAIHHFYKIEEMFALFHSVLRPGGLLIYDEYVGPDHHLYEPEVMAILDEINDCLAPRYRRDVIRNETRTAVPRATMESMLQMDPSEGVHASRILPLTYKWFDVAYRGEYGGTVMRPFFVGILPNFDWADPKDQTVARLIILVENLLTKYGVMPNYHMRVVGRRRDQPLADLTAEEEARINFSDWPGLSRKQE